MSLTITSTAVSSNGGAIPALYTRKANDIAPPLRWSGVPVRTQSLALKKSGQQTGRQASETAMNAAYTA
jgi:hypothetical protein